MAVENIMEENEEHVNGSRYKKLIYLGIGCMGKKMYHQNDISYVTDCHVPALTRFYCKIQLLRQRGAYDFVH
ncbi:hypothetical protein C5167_032067 [Papaver somniferum]|uniref:Uncharacterized protein n=1 Tax=Papaver somniferum TaxID=3469 RepID=A0A4Y7K6J6_PAPSO|nr:hypothetical protein C5167_032067 [Papaver somniferum]